MRLVKCEKCGKIINNDISNEHEDFMVIRSWKEHETLFNIDLCLDCYPLLQNIVSKFLLNKESLC